MKIGKLVSILFLTVYVVVVAAGAVSTGQSCYPCSGRHSTEDLLHQGGTQVWGLGRHGAWALKAVTWVLNFFSYFQYSLFLPNTLCIQTSYKSSIRFRNTEGVDDHSTFGEFISQIETIAINQLQNQESMLCISIKILLDMWCCISCAIRYPKNVGPPHYPVLIESAGPGFWLLMSWPSSDRKIAASCCPLNPHPQNLMGPIFRLLIPIWTFDFCASLYNLQAPCSMNHHISRKKDQ